MSTAAERLVITRARLKVAMLPPPEPLRLAGDVGSHESLVEKLKHLPAVALVIDTLSTWWAHHPLRPVTMVASEASNAVVRPLARQHPATLMVAAGLAGAVLAWTRPWRWALRSALFAGLVPQLAARVVSTLPIESWLNVLTSSLGAGKAGRPARTASPSSAVPASTSPGFAAPNAGAPSGHANGAATRPF